MENSLPPLEVAVGGDHVCFFLFSEQLNLERIIVPISAEYLIFFGLKLNLDRKIVPILGEDQFLSVLRLCNTPPHCRFLATRLSILSSL